MPAETQASRANLSNLSVLSYANGHTQWFYRTLDGQREIEGLNPPYFGALGHPEIGYTGGTAATVMHPGDIIHIHHTKAGHEGNSMWCVAASGAGFVRVVPMVRAAHRPPHFGRT